MHTTDMPIAFGDVRRSFFQSIVIMIFKIDIGLKQTNKKNQPLRNTTVAKGLSQWGA